MIHSHKNILYGLDSTFKNRGWHIKEENENSLSYTKKGQETDIFEIKMDSNMIYVSVPIKNSPFQYRTTFPSNELHHASDFVESRFYDYCD